MRTLATVALVVLVALAVAAPAGAAPVTRTQRAQNGPVVATLTWTQTDARNEYAYVKDIRVRIAREGAAPVDAAVTSGGDCPECGIQLGGRSNGKDRVVRVVDLNGDREPEVLVDLFTGGAHCCSEASVYELAAGGRYAAHRLFFGNVGYRLQDLDGDGVPELRSNDDRFSYAFTSYAGSIQPLQILSYERGGRLRNVTRAYPARIKKDAAGILKIYRENRTRTDGGDVRGVVAAYVAELFQLRRPKAAVAFLDAALRGPNMGLPGDGWATGAAYRRLVIRELGRWGYRR